MLLAPSILGTIEIDRPSRRAFGMGALDVNIRSFSGSSAKHVKVFDAKYAANRTRRISGLYRHEESHAAGDCHGLVAEAAVV
jgi:hypothetical protein